MSQELRCSSYKLHAIVTDNGEIEIQCRDRRCGYEPGIVILHRFNPDSGELVNTLKFNDPPRKGETDNGSARRHHSLRTA
jgi:hypothetical protein